MKPWLCLGALLVLWAGDARAVDSVLVPLELSGDEWVARFRRALDRVEEGRHGDGIEILQRAVDESLLPLNAAREQGGALVQVPAELPTGFSALRQALLDTWTRDAPEQRAQADDPRAEGGLVLDEGVDPRPAAPGISRRRINVVVGSRAQRVFLDPRAVPPEATRREARAEGRRFLPVGQVAAAILAALPQEALRVYGERYEGEAQAALSSALASFDSIALGRVARGRFLTDAGGVAAELTGDDLFERGEVGEALVWWRRILRDHPRPGAAEPRIRLKTLLALRRLGDARGYALERQRFLAAGGDEEELEALERSLDLVPAEARPASRGASLWGGELRLGRPPDLPGRNLHLSWDSWLWSQQGLTRVPTSGSFGARITSGNRVVTYYRPLHYPFVPLVADGSVYVSGVFSLYEFDGRPGGGALLSELRKPFKRELVGFQEDSDSCLYTTTLWTRDRDDAIELDGVPDRVLVTHYVSDLVKRVLYLGYDVTVKIPIRGLVAFDAETGRTLWATGLSDHALDAANPAGSGGPDEEVSELGGRPAFEGAAGGGAVEDPFLDDSFDPEMEILRPWGPGAGELGGGQTAALKDFSYTSPVIVRRGLVIAGGWAQRGYVNVSLRALDLRTGRVVWETPIVNSGQVERTLFGEMAREPYWGAIAEEGGVVYYLTQMGAVAAVDLPTGRLIWLSTYDSITVEATMSRSATRRDVYWGPNPLLVLGGVLVATPRDSEYLLAFDTGRGPLGGRAGGRILWRLLNLPQTSESGAALRDLIGYWRGRLYLAGHSEVAALDLRGMDAYGRLTSGSDLLDSPPRQRIAPRTPFSMPAPGALTSAGIVFADLENLKLLRLDTERLETLGAEPFRNSDWLYTGRVQVIPGRVLLVSRQLLSAFASAPPARASGAGRVGPF